MRRRIVNVFTAISLLLCMAAIALCIASFFVVIQIGWTSPFGTWAVGAMRGDLAGYRDVVHDQSRPSGIPMGFTSYVDRIAKLGFRAPPKLSDLFPGKKWKFAGFAVQSVDSTAMKIQVVIVPVWVIASVSALLPVRALLGRRAARRKARLAKNLCPNCGYDLRASSDRCPECGAVPELVPLVMLVPRDPSVNLG